MKPDLWPAIYQTKVSTTPSSTGPETDTKV